MLHTRWGSDGLVLGSAGLRGSAELVVHGYGAGCEISSVVASAMVGTCEVDAVRGYGALEPFGRTWELLAFLGLRRSMRQ